MSFTNHTYHNHIKRAGFPITQSPKITLTAYNLFALAVISMIFGHVFYYFMPDINWARVPDRILVPVFLVSIGYNSGHPVSRLLIFSTLLLCAVDFLILKDYQVNILGTIILLRYTIEPFAQFLLKNKVLFWGTHAVFVALFPITDVFFEYGTLAYIMALAGWINKNGAEVSGKVVKPAEYFIYITVIYIITQQIVFDYSPVQTIIMACGASVTMYLLFNMRTLLANSIKRKPKDFIGRFCKFLGHRSLEIYVVHILLFQAILYYALFLA